MATIGVVEDMLAVFDACTRRVVRRGARAAEAMGEVAHQVWNRNVDRLQAHLADRCGASCAVRVAEPAEQACKMHVLERAAAAAGRDERTRRHAILADAALDLVLGQGGIKGMALRSGAHRLRARTGRPGLRAGPQYS